MAGKNLRGLTVFISDIRNCQSKEAEQKRVDKELHNIRQKFKKSTNMDSYDKKKYVCKLLYIHLLGYEFDFGHMEAVNLVSGNKYSEKQIGYLACAILLNENSELVRLIINTIQNDLMSQNEVFACMALASVANIGGKEMAEALVPSVAKLLVTSTTRPPVKKKAALCLLRLYRKWPDCMPPNEWTDRVLNLLEHTNYGVLTAVMSLVLSLVVKHPLEYEGSVRKAVWILNNIVIKKEYPEDYQYYGVASPWLQVKLLRLLQFYPPSEDRNMLNRLVQVLRTIINTEDANKNMNHKNALNAVLFEAIDLIIHLDCDAELMIQAANLLGRFIKSKETNVKYLGLDKMSHLAIANQDSLEQIKRYQDTIILSLKDTDISIRRRALDLLYSMCDKSNSEVIVKEMLDYLVGADYAIRDELVLKIAVLAEKFAPNLTWYVDSILKLIQEGGDHVSDDVWFRVVQIVTNNEDLQEYAAQKCLQALKSPQCHEIAVKVAGYILGEFGHTLVETDASVTPKAMFDLMHAKFEVAATSTKALLLSTYIKMVNLFPELKDEVMQVLYAHEQYMDAEVQQRSCEYLVLAQQDPELMNTVWDVMPVFPERESAVILQIEKNKEKGRTDTVSPPSDDDDDLGVVARRGHLPEAEEEEEAAAPAAAAPPAESAPVPPAKTGMADLLSGDAPSSTGGGGQKSDLNDLLGLGGGSSGGGAPSSLPSSDSPMDDEQTQARFRKLEVAEQGLLYEDDQIQVGWKSQYNGAQGRLGIFPANKGTTSIAPYSLTVLNDQPGLKISVQPITEIGAGQQMTQMLAVECTQGFTNCPVVKMQLGSRSIQLRLPVGPLKFLTPQNLPGPDFIKMWGQIGGGNNEAQIIIKASSTVESATAAKLLEGLKLAVLPGVDTQNPSNVVAAAMWTSTAAKAPLVTRLEVNTQMNMYRLTTRSPAPPLIAAFHKTVVANLGTLHT